MIDAAATRSPPTLRTMSANMVVVATTFSASGRDDGAADPPGLADPVDVPQPARIGAIAAIVTTQLGGMRLGLTDFSMSRSRLRVGDVRRRLRSWPGNGGTARTARAG